MSGSHFIRHMLEVMTMQRRAEVAKCSRCKESAATCRCMTCEIFMCKKCWEAHESIHESWPGFKKHSVLTINELAQPEHQRKMRGTLCCKEHRDKKLKFYCKTCQEIICRYCMDFNHVRPDHLCLPIEKVAEKKKEALKSSLGILDTKLMEGNQALQGISNVRQTLKEDAKRAKDEIIKQKEEEKETILEKLEESVRRKIDQVDEAYNEMNEELAKHENEMKLFVEKIKGSVTLSQNLLERGTNEEILSSQKMIEGSVEKAQKQHPKNVEPNSPGNIEYRVMLIDHSHLMQFVNTLGVVVCKSVMHGTLMSDDSIILKDKPEYVKQMIAWLKDHNFKWHLCYRASRDGWKAEDFHAHCDNKGPTVTVVNVGDYTFGGYTDQNWKGYGLKSSTSSFLFSLKNKDNLSPFKALVNHPEKAIFANQECGPVFGNNKGDSPDLCIASQPHINKASHSMFGHVYKLPKGYMCDTTKANSVLAGSQYFKPAEIEVFF